MWIKLFTTMFFKLLRFSRPLHLKIYQLYYFSSYSLNFVCRKALLPLCHSYFEQTWKFRCSEICNLSEGGNGVKKKCNELETSHFGVYLKSNSIYVVIVCILQHIRTDQSYLFAVLSLYKITFKSYFIKYK